MKLILLLTTFIVCLQANAQWIKIGSPTSYDVNFLVECLDKPVASINGKLCVGVKENNNYTFYVTDMVSSGIESALVWNDYLITGSSNGFASLYDSVEIGKRLYTKAIGGGKISTIERINDRLIFGTANGIFISDDLLVSVTKQSGRLMREVNDFQIAKEVIYAASDSGLFVSPDSGSTWYVKAFPKSYVSGCKIVNDTFFVGRKNGLYYSIDNGATWNKDSFFGSDEIRKIFIQQGSLYIATQNQLFKRDDLQGWTEIQPGVGGPYSSVLSLGRDLLVGSVWGLAMKENNEWKSVQTFFRTEANNLGKLASDGKYMLTGTDIRGLHVSEDFGQTWKMKTPPFSYGGTVYAIQNTFIADGQWYASTAISLFRSSDSAQTWQPIVNGLDAPNTVIEMYKIAGKLWACSDKGLYNSIDNGDTWSLAFATKTRRLAPSPNGKIFAATSQGIFESLPPYITWDSSSFQPGFEVMDFKFKGDTIYATTVLGGVFRTFNGGTSWQQITNGLLNSSIFNLQIAEKHAFVSDGNVGIYSIAHNGNTFTEVNDNLPYGGINSFIIVDNTIYVSVQFGGFFARSLDTFDIPLGINNPSENNAYIFPNPAAGFINIINNNDLEEAVLCDLSGKSIVILNKNNSTNISDLSSGIYILKATRKDGSTVTDKLVKE